MLINPRGNARFLARLRGTKVPGRLVDLLEDAVASLAGGLRFALGARASTKKSAGPFFKTLAGYRPQSGPFE
jgi:hypothetical protein